MGRLHECKTYPHIKGMLYTTVIPNTTSHIRALVVGIYTSYICMQHGLVSYAKTYVYLCVCVLFINYYVYILSGGRGFSNLGRCFFCLFLVFKVKLLLMSLSNTYFNMIVIFDMSHVIIDVIISKVNWCGDKA